MKPFSQSAVSSGIHKIRYQHVKFMYSFYFSFLLVVTKISGKPLYSSRGASGAVGD
jgi:hypothetical protein